jgi:hypothetical protein
MEKHKIFISLVVFLNLSIFLNPCPALLGNTGQTGILLTENTSVEYLETTDNTTMQTVALDSKPDSSPYEYFLFSRYTQEPSTRTLVLAHIRDDRIELKDIVTENFGSYHWGDPICVTGGKLYSVSYNNLYSIDLLTKETEQLTVKSTNSLAFIPGFGITDDIFDFGIAVLERCFANNCLYGLAQTGGKTVLRQIDFEKVAYRDIADVSLVKSSRNIAISLDRKKLAYFSLYPIADTPSKEEGRLFMTVVNIESGQITQPARPIKFIVPMIASVFPGIPIIWLDTETVAFIRTEVPEGETMFSPNRKAAHILSSVNVNTGLMEDITPLPGDPYGFFAPDLIQDNVGIGPLVQLKLINNRNSYRVDLKNRKLVENDLIAGDYKLADSRLNFNGKDLGSVRPGYFNVSDDGERIIWMSNEAISLGSAKLYYYDRVQAKPVVIARVYNSAGLWIKSDDLKRQPSTTDLGSQWTSLKDISKNLPVQTNTPARKYIRDYLACTIKIDKSTYFLHEPVQVTLTLTNISSSNIKVKIPRVYTLMMTPSLWLTLNYPGGSKSIYRSSRNFNSPAEEVLLQPGQSVSDADVIEVSQSGDYRLDYKYQKNDPQDYFWGTVTAESAAFNVVKVTDSAEQKLFDAKFARIIEKIHKEIALDPNWSGNIIFIDEVTGFPGMGPAAAPYIIKAIDSETNKYFRKLLLQALSMVADSQYIPFFRQQLIKGETDPVCNWILKIYRQSGTDKDITQQALDALLSGMSNKEVKARRDACRNLTKIYNEQIESYFKKAVEDEDEQIRLDAGYYLAAAKRLNLADWLRQAASEPTYEQYISSTAVIKKLEEQWNISKGKLPLLVKEDFKIAERIQETVSSYTNVINNWLTWAQENPRASSLFFEDYRQQWSQNDPLRESDQ